MNRQKKVLSIFFILTYLTILSSLSVFAQSGNQSEPYFPDLTLPSSSAVSAVSSKAAVTSSAPVSAQSSSLSSASEPPNSSKPASTSSRPERTVQYQSSSEVLSGDSSGAESGGIGGAVSGLPSSSSQISLPSVASVPENDPLDSVVTDTKSAHQLNWLGLLSWALIAIGIIVVLIVVFSNRHPPHGPGRRRYRRPKRSKKKRLLNDKYYRDIDRY